MVLLEDWNPGTRKVLLQGRAGMLQALYNLIVYVGVLVVVVVEMALVVVLLVVLVVVVVLLTEGDGQARQTGSRVWRVGMRCTSLQPHWEMPHGTILSTCKIRTAERIECVYNNA